MSRLVLVRNGAAFQPADGDVVLHSRELRGWLTRGGPLRALLAHRDAAIATPSLCQSGRPFALDVDDIRLGGFKVPSVLVGWVFRNIDPSSRLAERLPVPVEITTVRVTADAIRIGD